MPATVADGPTPLVNRPTPLANGTATLAVGPATPAEGTDRLAADVIARAGASVDLDPPPELLILVADKLDQLGIRHNLLIDPHREWLCVRLRVIDGDVQRQSAECWPREAFGKFRVAAVRAAAHVQPPIERTVFRSAQVVRFDDERVAVPMTD